jgi:murein DD-endopeptidase MepM/ murein hydrolase activator NlpD
MLKRRFALLFLTLICAASASSFVVYAQEESPEDAATRAAEERAAAESRRIQEEEAAKERANAEILRLQINSRAKEINKLETEISKYQKELNTVSAQKRTLTNTIYELDLNRKRTTANIALTKERIGDAEERIQSLTKEVGTRSEALKRMIAATAETIRSVDSTEDTSFMENFLRNGTLSTTINNIENLRDVQQTVQARVELLRKERKAIETLKAANENQKVTLAKQQKNYLVQKQSLDITRATKTTILAQTKNQESEYQRILAEKKKAKAAFEAEMASYESQLRYVLDRTKIPSAGKGILTWPLDKVRITQKFGTTAFAKSGAYGGKGHNGVDFQASVGTPVKAALTGTVLATGNTDVARGCYSYGKYVLLRHPNGLATLYGHLSVINVSAGQSVTTGEVIGYSGNTGYSTGPHLHFTVYAADAVKVVKMGDVRSSSPCRNVAVPVSAWSGYLNPLEYL